MQSITSKIFMAILRMIFHSSLFDSSKLSDNAAKLTKDKKSRYKPSKNFTYTKHSVEDVKYEKIINKNCCTKKVILMIHGGGFKIELNDFYRKLAEKYSNMFCGATVINADYGRFPEHQLPSQMYDVIKIYLHLLDEGINNSDITVIGDSAGATLAMTSSLWLRDNNYPLPGHIVCFSLWADATSSGDSKITNAYTDPFYGIAKHKRVEDNLHLLRRISKYVLNVDRTDPYISPLFGSFEKFPKVTLLCGTAELDESDSDRVYDKMKNANIDVELYKFEGMCHCFQLFSFLPESKEAYKLVKARIMEDKKMKILDNSDKHLLPVLPKIVSKELNLKADKFKFIGGGSFGRVYKTVLSDGETIAVKAYRVQGSQYEEAQQLELLSANTSVNMPEVLFTYEDEDTAILAMSFCPGQNVLNPMFLLKNKEKKQKFADDVISGMLEWHSVTNDKFGDLSNPKYDTWLEYYKKEKQEPWLAGLNELAQKGKFSKKKLQLLTEATEFFNNIPEENTKPVLIHADLNIMNIMADPKTLELTAFIDPCGSIWADKEYDLFQFRNMWGDAYGLYEAYKRNSEISEFTDFRVAYYASMHEAAMRLKGGLIMPLWEDLNNARLKKEIKKLKEKM